MQQSGPGSVEEAGKPGWGDTMKKRQVGGRKTRSFFCFVLGFFIVGAKARSEQPSNFFFF